MISDKAQKSSIRMIGSERLKMMRGKFNLYSLSVEIFLIILRILIITIQPKTLNLFHSEKNLQNFHSINKSSKKYAKDYEKEKLKNIESICLVGTIREEGEFFVFFL
jgi:hypothetical protein